MFNSLVVYIHLKKTQLTELAVMNQLYTIGFRGVFMK